MVRRDVGLALGAVDYYMLDTTERRLNLRVGREGRAAHAGYARRAYDFDYFFGRGVGKLFFPRMYFGREPTLAVVFDHDRFHLLSGRRVFLDYLLDFARDARVVRDTEPFVNPRDQLTAVDPVARLDYRLGGHSDVHRHRYGYAFGRRELFDYAVTRILVLVNMNAAAEG